MEKLERQSEAIKRMEYLKLHENVIKEFKNEEKLNASEFGGILYWLNDKEKELVKQFEEEHNATVYHVIKSIVWGCEHFSMLYVSNEDDEWSCDWEDLKQGYALAYVINQTNPSYSEFGTIGIKSNIGGLMRTC